MRFLAAYQDAKFVNGWLNQDADEATLTQDAQMSFAGCAARLQRDEPPALPQRPQA